MRQAYGTIGPLVAVLLLAPVAALAAPPSETRDQIICRAKSGVGFSYWWGGACWCANGCSPNFGCSKGSCSGNCPSCSHSGGHGADCSGFTNKVWQVPSAMSLNGSCAHGGYVAASYTKSATHWDKISRSNILKADALASSTHVMVYESGDPWGSLWAYEAKGCSYGIKHNIRTCSSAYSAARRHNIISGECKPGQTQSQGCGNCGSKKRTCSSGGKWGSWGSCGGQGACAPGKKESAACGKCGSKSRTCNSSCGWGGWSSCSSQGACSPGQTETTGCGNCGNKSRTCSGSCGWGAWGACTGAGPCAPGQSETAGCGNCGNMTRTCSGACQWDGYGACQGEGPCAPGQGQTEACGDCGEHSRSCGATCQWADWDGCEGPDPNGGNNACDTGELGVCSDGRERCVHGWTQCLRLVDPSAELCDDLDNDCDGPADEEHPTTMGAPPPAYAANLEDLSFPPALSPGEVGMAWVELRNVGTKLWPKGKVWLSANDGPDGGATGLFPPGQWPAWDVAAVLPEDVAPGGSARLVLPLQMPDTGQAPPHARLVLLAPDGSEMRCPQPEVELAVKEVPGMGGEAQVFVEGGPVDEDVPQQGVEGPHAVEVPPETAPTAEQPAPAPEPTGEEAAPAGRSTQSGCGTAADAPATPALALLLLALYGFRRRASVRSRHRPHDRS